MAAAKPGSWQYHSEVLTDQSPDEVCTNIIREKLLEYLPQEVPYSMTQVTREAVQLLISQLKSFFNILYINLKFFF